jgi:hypothetical protein
MRIRFLPLILSPFLLCLPADAQTIGGSFAQQILKGSASEGWFGRALSSAGDVNADGFDDVLVGALAPLPGGSAHAGSAFVYSGLDGSLLHQWGGALGGDLLGAAVAAAGDLNADGHDDLLVSAFGASPGGLSAAGTVFAYSGADGSVLYQWNGAHAGDILGWSIAGVGDLNADGHDDVVLGAWDADPNGLSGAGSAFAYSGADGSLLLSWDGTLAYDAFGFSVSGVGDVNQDGTPDIVVGSAGATRNGLQGCGMAQVFSGADGSLLWEWDGVETEGDFGHVVAGAGDLNADGCDDILVGAHVEDGGGFHDGGTTYALSGADGALLYRWYGQSQNDRSGSALCGIGDINRDGFDDVLIGAPLANPNGLNNAGVASLYSGIDGSLIERWYGTTSHDRLGHAVANAGDTDGDGYDDLLVSAPLTAPFGLNQGGSVFVYRYRPALFADRTTISVSTSTTLHLELDFPSHLRSTPYRLLMSAHGTGPIHFGVDIPLTLDRFLVQSAVGSYPFAMASGLHGHLDTHGNASASIDFPAGAYQYAMGTTFWLAAVVKKGGAEPSHSSAAVAVELIP